jgi:branched-chain amino acid transport system substrate-binding protein
MRSLMLVLALIVLGVVLAPQMVQAQAPARIGFIYPDSGPFAQLGLDMRDGFLLYWSEVGSRAGGRPVELVLETKGTSKPDEGLTKARKLVERDRVQILGGIISTPVAYALRGDVIENKIPIVIMHAGADGLTQRQKSDYVFRSSFVNSDSSHPLGEWAYKQGYRKMALAASDFSAGYEHIGGIARTFTDAGGQVIQEIYPPLGAPDFAPYLTQIKREADVVAAFFGGADALRFVSQYAEFGLKGKIPLIGKGLTDESLLLKQGDAAIDLITAWHWSAALDTPANKRFIDAYASKYKRPATTYAEHGYVGALMMAKALETVKGNVENQTVFLDALRRVEADAPRGKMKLDAYHAPIHTVYVLKVEKKGGALQNVPIASYPNTNQFWKWNPDAFTKLTPYGELKGKWAK